MSAPRPTDAAIFFASAAAAGLAAKAGCLDDPTLGRLRRAAQARPEGSPDALAAAAFEAEVKARPEAAGERLLAHLAPDAAAAPADGWTARKDCGHG